jgi:mycothiol synthase
MVEASLTIEVQGAPPIPGLVFRTFRGATDISAVTELMNAVEIADGSFEILSEAALSNYLANLADFEPTRDLLLAEVDGQLIAIAQRLRVLRDDALTYELLGWVHPDWRRRGLGRAMLRYGEARQRERAAADATSGETRPTFLSAWSHESSVGTVALLEAEGYQPVRWFFEMGRQLDAPIPDVVLPPGLELRPIDDEAQARVVLAADNEAFRDHWGARDSTEADVRRILGDPDTDLSLWQIAWAGDEVVGSVIAQIYPADNEASGVRRGWLDRVSVRRAWRRQGIGRALIAASLAVLRRRGMDVASLGVDADNQTGALGLYEGLGFRQDKRSIAYRKPIHET